MYERFTDDARKVFQFANQEAQRFNHDYIDTEHILLGIIKNSFPPDLFTRFDVDPRQLRQSIEQRIRSGPDMVIMGKLPKTPLAKKVVEEAMNVARAANHSFVDVRHIFLALYRVPDGLATQVLNELGITPEQAAARLDLHWVGLTEAASVTQSLQADTAVEQRELSQERMGQMALLFLRDRVRSENLLIIDPEVFRQRLAKIAEITDSSLAEAASFVKELAREILQKQYPDRSDLASLSVLPINLV